MIKRFIGAALAVFLLVGSSHGQLLVDVQLGQLGLGNANVSGDTTMFGNETDYYALTNAAVNWGNELVYEFSLTGSTTGFYSLNVMRNSVTGDPDFFILNDVATVVDANGKTLAPGNLGNFFLDGADGEVGLAITVPAGTYFLSASTFAGADGATTMDQATFDIDIIVEEGVPPTPPANAIDLGVIADVNVPFNIDTFGSSFDTELGLYNAGGFIVALNDDAAVGVLDSEIVLAGLGQGTYYIAVAEFNAVYNTGFDVTTTGANGGDFNLNFNGMSRTESLNPGAVQFYVFEIGAAGSGFVPPASFTNFRGVSINSAVTDFADSDDVDASYNPGFVLNDTEAPVWLIFDGVAADATAFRVESDAGTPGLEYTVEAFNWSTNAFDVIGTEVESFNADTVSETAIVPADHIEAGTGNVRTRVGWRQFGFVINFPWQVNVDQTGWVQ